MSPVRGSLLLLVLSCAACNGGFGPTKAAEAAAEETEDPPPLVRIATLETRRVRRELEATSYLESEHEVTVYSKVPGRVLEVFVDEGQEVGPDDPLARLDDREATAALRQIAVQVEDRKVRAQLAALEQENAQSRIEQAQIERERTKAEYDRQSSIDPTLVSPKILQEAKFAYEAAEKALTVALANAKKSALDREAAQNAIKELQERYAEQELRVAEHRISAHMEGVVTSRMIRGGEMITGATPLFVVTDLKNLISYIGLPQVQMPVVRGAKEVVFTTDAYGDREFTADIDLVSRVIDKANGSFRIRMRVRAADAALLRPGMFVRARILTEQDRDALMIPKAALLSEGERFVVFALRGGKAAKLVVELGLEEEDYVECRSRGDDALRPGDRVIVSGHESLQDQDRVEVVQDS